MHVFTVYNYYHFLYLYTIEITDKDMYVDYLHTSNSDIVLAYMHLYGNNVYSFN